MDNYSLRDATGMKMVSNPTAKPLAADRGDASIRRHEHA